MKKNTLPGADISISQIMLGTWVFGGDMWSGAKKEESLAAIKAGIEGGINTIDTAPIYGRGQSEEIIGQAVKSYDRSDIILATKCGLTWNNNRIQNDLSPQSIFQEVENSLKRLDTDYIDIYQCHWPDPKIEIEQTCEALLKLVQQQKIRAIGVSNFDSKLLKRALDSAPVISLQNQYSMLERSIEKDPLPFCKENNIGVLTYGPLAGGILTGKYTKARSFAKSDARNFFYKYYSGSAFEKVQFFIKQLEEIGRPVAEIALNWIRQQEGVSSVIVGCRNSAQVQKNLNALTWDLTEDQRIHINTLLDPLS